MAYAHLATEFILVIFEANNITLETLFVGAYHQTFTVVAVFGKYSVPGPWNFMPYVTIKLRTYLLCGSKTYLMIRPESA
jgi:hypothetical protein